MFSVLFARTHHPSTTFPPSTIRRCAASHSPFARRSDGSWETNGSIPSGLEDLTEHRRGRADLLWVALGADDEWCVRSKGGRVWWENASVEADEALAHILAEDGENELNFIDFGRDDTYFLLHK